MVFDRSVTNEQKIFIESRLAAHYGIANSTSDAPSVFANAAGSGNYILGTTGAVLNFTDPSNTAGSLTAVTGTNPGSIGILPDGVTAFSSDKFWSITHSGLTSFIYSITLDLTGISGITDFESLKILKRADATSQWQDVSQAPINATVIYHEPFITVYGLSSFSDFAVGSNEENTLPVELSAFTGQISDGKVVLNWSTSTETNNYGWEIQRSAEPEALEGSASYISNHDPSRASGSSSDWETIGFVAGKGTTTEAHSYSFLSPATSLKSLFRLKQTDLDGKFEYSRILSIEPVPQNFELSGNYPNPFNPSTSIKFSLPEKGNVTLRVYSVLGQLVETRILSNLEAGVQLVPFSGSGLASGHYFYQLQFNTKVLNGRMTLLK
ncbi:MAG: T9SS type A sorting domain-containing protein [Bacteroidetes bacterium]|nr:T9SS type A sorting domain-containing protein [Bacteroidota bacterium]